MGEVIKTLNIKALFSAKPLQLKSFFDSGSRRSFLREDVAYKLGTPLTLEEPIPFRALGNGGFNCDKVMVLWAEIEGFWCEHFYYVVKKEDLEDEVLIGTDFMQTYGIKLDLDKEDIIVDTDRLNRSQRIRFNNDGEQREVRKGGWLPKGE